MHRVNFADQLQHLLPLALAQVEKANPHRVAVVDGLNDATEPERQALVPELSLYARVNADREPIVGADAATSQAQIQNAAS